MIKYDYTELETTFLLEMIDPTCMKMGLIIGLTEHPLYTYILFHRNAGSEQITYSQVNVKYSNGSSNRMKRASLKRVVHSK